jgi:hypothetical protein
MPSSSSRPEPERSGHVRESLPSVRDDRFGAPAPIDQFRKFIHTADGQTLGHRLNLIAGEVRGRLGR